MLMWYGMFCKNGNMAVSLWHVEMRTQQCWQEHLILAPGLDVHVLTVLDTVGASMSEKFKCLKLSSFEWPAGGDLQKVVWLYVSLWGSDPTFHLSYSLSKQSPNEFMASFASLKSSSTQHDFHFVNYGHIWSKTDNKAGHALGRGYIVIVRTRLLSQINQDIPPQLHTVTQIWSIQNA